MPVIRIDSLDLPELEPFRSSSEKLLRRRGTFIAESPKVIRTALSAGYTALSLLASERMISGQAADIIEKCRDIPVYTASEELLAELTGFRMTQGLLALMRRLPEKDPGQILTSAKRVAVLEDITNQTNVGAIFRSAAALSFDAVLLSPGTSDPLLRRSVRVSMGTVLQVPWAYLPDGSPGYVSFLKEQGFAAAALALREDTVPINDRSLAAEERLAVILGTEGTGLREETISVCDYAVKIPMAEGVDSLNVAAASAVAFWQLGPNNSSGPG
ncbi:MAG: RNA methyltransferase [Ruminococcus sp.]|nr:RNA methyltransferase [Ruminococcus sp.]